MKVLAIATVASLGFVGASLAHPLDSPGTVYIDGLPCNLLCQSWMGWSRQTHKANQHAAKGGAKTSAARESKKALRKRISRRPGPALAAAQFQRKTRDLQAAMETHEPPGAPATDRGPQSVSKSETGNAALAMETSNPPGERSPEELVTAALAVANQITNAEPPKASDRVLTDETRVGDTNASKPLVALVLSRPELKSASELKGLNVAIDAAESTIEPDIRFALAAVGATEARVSVSDTSPLHRLISGDVQAAIVKLVSADAAEAFPDIKGFKVLRVPLFRSGR